MVGKTISHFTRGIKMSGLRGITAQRLKKLSIRILSSVLSNGVNKILEKLGEVRLLPYPESSAGMWKISDGGGGYPLWSPDGKKIYYKSGNAMYSVDVTATDSFSKGNPEKIFEGNYFLPRQRGFDIHPGRRQIHHDSEAKCHSHGTANLYHSEFFGRTETAGARGQGLKRSENLPRIHSRQLG